MWQAGKARILGFLAFLLIRLLSLTWRYKIHDEVFRSSSPGTIWLLAHWHGDELALLPLVSRLRPITLVSLSRDGELMATVLKRLGATVVRGSSSKHRISGLKKLIQETQLKATLNSWATISLAVDGPKGPRHKVKPGILHLRDYFSSQARLIAVGVFCDKKWIFRNSWSQAYLPKWGAVIKVMFMPIDLPIGDTDLEPLKIVEEALLRSGTLAQNL